MGKIVCSFCRIGKFWGTLQNLIEIFTDKGDVVIDPVAGSGSTLLAAIQTNRQAYGFEIKKNFYKEATEKTLSNIQKQMFWWKIFQTCRVWKIF